jgi:hypothetical protein
MYPSIVGNMLRLIDTGFEPHPVAPSDRLATLDFQASGPLSPAPFVSSFSELGDLARGRQEVAL